MHKRLLLWSGLSLLALFFRAEDLFSQGPAAAAVGKVRIACIGDSITYGSGIEQRERYSYPSVLQRLLGEAYDVKNFGVSGATLLKIGDKPYWRESAFVQASDFEPNSVVIKLGTNDTKPQNWRHKAEFADDLRAFIDHFAQLRTKPRVWICLPVPVHKANFGVNQPALDEQLPIIKTVAAEKGVTVIDLFAALKPHPQYFPDGIHPDAAGADVIARTLHDALLKKPAEK